MGGLRRSTHDAGACTQHLCTRACMHAHAHAQASVRACMQAHAHACKHTRIHASTHACMQAHAQGAHTRMHSIHACMHPCARKHTRGQHARGCMPDAPCISHAVHTQYMHAWRMCRVMHTSMHTHARVTPARTYTAACTQGSTSWCGLFVRVTRCSSSVPAGCSVLVSSAPAW